jgi:thiamine pyrophosphokinase
MRANAPRTTSTTGSPPTEHAGHRALVLSGGDAPLHPALAGHLLTGVVTTPGGVHTHDGVRVFAVDSGYRHAQTLGLSVQTLVGDLDSIEAEDLQEATARGVTIVPHPVDKDATDLELTLDLARVGGATSLTVVSGGPGARLDHHLAEIDLLGSPRAGRLRIDAYVGPAYLCVVRPTQPLTLRTRVGATVSLLPISSRVRGIRTTGLRFPLHAETLHRHRTRGVSNEARALYVHVTVEQGTLLAIVPHYLDELPAHEPEDQV